MNLQKISEAKKAMESMYESIYELQESIIDEKKDFQLASENFKTKSMELYLVLISITSISESDYIKRETGIEILSLLIEKISGYTIDELKGQTRKREIVLPRQIHMTFLSLTFSLTKKDIGTIFGRHHATVIHACKTVKNLYQTDKGFRYKYAEIFDHCVNYDASNNSTNTIDFLNEK